MGYRLTEKGEKWLWNRESREVSRPNMFYVLETIYEGESLLSTLVNEAEISRVSGSGRAVENLLKEIERLEREGYIESDDSGGGL